MRYLTMPCAALAALLALSACAHGARISAGSGESNAAAIEPVIAAGTGTAHVGVVEED